MGRADFPDKATNQPGFKWKTANVFSSKQQNFKDGGRKAFCVNPVHIYLTVNTELLKKNYIYIIYIIYYYNYKNNIYLWLKNNFRPLFNFRNSGATESQYNTEAQLRPPASSPHLPPKKDSLKHHQMPWFRYYFYAK